MTTRAIFIVVAVALLAAGFYIRAHNLQSANSQVASIISLDAAGSDTTTAVANLKSYVTSHMGTSASFTLSVAYKRAQTAASAAAAQAAANSQVYAAAQSACSGRTDSITQAECNQRYLAQHLVAEPSAGQIAAPILSNYQYNLKAPLWTPDAAGACLLGALLALIAASASLLRPKRRSI
jgi:hypothetical protein